MRNGTPGFQAERLVEARDARGLTQVALAELINLTSTTISRWESGGQLPEADALEALARATNLPQAFFLRPRPGHGSAPMFFRSMASTTQAARKRSKARLRWAQDISIHLQEWVDLPQTNVPRLDVNDLHEIRDADIERIAVECRELWGLGMGPISDVILALENAGVVVIKEEVGTSTLDGVSNWSEVDGRPYALIASDKATCVRSRMDAAHELGHLILHRGLNERALNDKIDFKELERQAFHFAGAFLMPAESFASEVWSPSLNAFLSLKERWRVSVAAMMKRCSNLGITSEEYDRRIWKHYSARGWRKEEPLDDSLISESPRLLSRSVRLLIDEGVRKKEDILSDFRLRGADVESLCGLARGYMTSEDSNVIGLPTLKSPSGTARQGNAQVVPFKSR